MGIYFLTIYRPVVAFKRLLDNPAHVKLGFLYMLIPMAGYTAMYIFLTLGKGAPSTFEPWLNIPKERYYAVNRFLLAPSMILCWWVATAYIQLMTRIFNGKGSFEQTLAVIGLSISLAMWGGLIHDLPMSFLSATGIIDAKQHEIAMNSPTIFRTLLWIAYGIYFFAFVTLFSIAVRVVHQVSKAGSTMIGVSAFMIFQLLFFVFNR